jgi:multidrug efflux pump subunit AcrA (membrane-fusion protein)
MRTSLITLCALALLVGADFRPENRLPPSVQLLHCQVLLDSDVDIAAEESGLLVAVHVADGQEVTEGTLMVQLDDRRSQLDKMAAELERDAAVTRAADDIEVKYSIKSFELAEAELSQSIEINRRSPGSVPTSEVRRQQLAKHRAELQIERSRLELAVAQMTAKVRDAAVHAADENILRRQITAPFDGTVLEIFRLGNEWVNAGEPVMRLVRLDQLRVDGFISGSDFDSAEIAGRSVTVEVELARGQRAKFEGRVAFVNPLVQHGNKFRVRAIVLNQKRDGHWLLRPGMEATMTIDLRN